MNIISDILRACVSHSLRGVRCADPGIGIHTRTCEDEGSEWGYTHCRETLLMSFSLEAGLCYLPFQFGRFSHHRSCSERRHCRPVPNPVLHHLGRPELRCCLPFPHRFQAFERASARLWQCWSTGGS